MTTKATYFTQRIGGIPTVLRRGDAYNMQISQHQTMKAANEEAARLNRNADHK